MGLHHMVHKRGYLHQDQALTQVRAIAKPPFWRFLLHGLNSKLEKWVNQHPLDDISMDRWATRYSVQGVCVCVCFYFPYVYD